MEKITKKDITIITGMSAFYLLGVVGFLVFKLFHEISIEYIIVIALSILGIVCIFRVGDILEKAISSEGSFNMNFIDNIITEFGLMGILGGISMYIVFYKGFYGLYELTNEFTWFLLIFRLFIVFIGIKLIKHTDKLQTGFKTIQSKNYTVE